MAPSTTSASHNKKWDSILKKNMTFSTFFKFRFWIINRLILVIFIGRIVVFFLSMSKVLSEFPQPRSYSKNWLEPTEKEWVFSFPRINRISTSHPHAPPLGLDAWSEDLYLKNLYRPIRVLWMWKHGSMFEKHRHKDLMKRFQHFAGSQIHNPLGGHPRARGFPGIYLFQTNCLFAFVWREQGSLGRIYD